MLSAFKEFANLFKGDRVNARVPIVQKLPIPEPQTKTTESEESNENGDATDAKPGPEEVPTSPKRRAGKKGAEPRKKADN